MCIILIEMVKSTKNPSYHDQDNEHHQSNLEPSDCCERFRGTYI
jgi:hypothetical protein